MISESSVPNRVGIWTMLYSTQVSLDHSLIDTNVESEHWGKSFSDQTHLRGLGPFYLDLITTLTSVHLLLCA